MPGVDGKLDLAGLFAGPTRPLHVRIRRPGRNLDGLYTIPIYNESDHSPEDSGYVPSPNRNFCRNRAGLYHRRHIFSDGFKVRAAPGEQDAEVFHGKLSAINDQLFDTS